MNTAAIREKLVNYMQVADEKKVKAIYTKIEDEINTTENDWDEDFIQELERRSRHLLKEQVRHIVGKKQSKMPSPKFRQYY